eukprot:2823011-Ditylum_brightwellii.AAC.1
MGQNAIKTHYYLQRYFTETGLWQRITLLELGEVPEVEMIAGFLFKKGKRWCIVALAFGAMVTTLSNHCEGNIVKDVPGMNVALVGKTISEIASELEGNLKL